VIPHELRTERLLLRQWREDDAEPLAEIHADPRYVVYMRPLDLERTRQLILWCQLSWRHEGFGLWAAEELESGRLVGRIGLIRHHDWPEASDPVEVGWVLHPDWWGRGLATEGGRAAVQCWREHLDDPQLISITRPDNVRSRAVMKRLGLTERGTAHWHGHDVVWYALDR
jgi:RimJ/RimL family protein N-acetyltransferase